MMKRARLFLTLSFWAASSAASPPPAHPVDVPVSSYHLRMSDLFADLDPEAAAIELGASPAPSASRVVDREEILRAFREHGITPPRVVPAAVRVVRKTQRLDPSAISDLVRTCLGDTLPTGVTVSEVHGSRTSVPEGWTRAACQVPRPPHKAGPQTSSANVTFFEGDQALWRLIVPVELSVSQEGTKYDVSRGAHLTLLIRRGLVEVGASGTAGADADVGDLMTVILLPSGRSLPARLEDRDHAVAVGAP